MHVRAVSDGKQWSGTAHRAIRIDMSPPQAQLSLDPGQPSGDDGWYVTPVTVTASAADGAGSGVASLEISTDGVTWQPYTAPLVFTADTPGATIYARATDGVGLISETVSTTVKIDQTPPNSHVTGGAGPGALIARVITNTLGNQELVLVGAITDDGSGRSGMSVEHDGLDWTGTTEIASLAGHRSRPTGSSRQRMSSVRATTSFSAGLRMWPATKRSHTRSHGSFGTPRPRRTSAGAAWRPRPRRSGPAI